MLALTVSPADAKGCRQETLLPADTRIVPPSPNVPPDVSRFSGAWNGAWKDRTGADAQCHTLVVEEVFPNGFARVIYSLGTHEPWAAWQPRSWRASGRIVDGVLRFQLPTVEKPDLTYRFADGGLAGVFKRGPTEGRVTLTRVMDVSQVGCPPLLADLSPPPVGGPRDRVTADDLFASRYVGDGPVHNDYFMPVGPPAPARHSLRGTLTVGAGRSFSAHKGCAGLPTPGPGFSAAFFTHGDHLVPVVRTIMSSPGATAQLPLAFIVSPGRVWSEPGDRGMSRASFPFVVVDRITNGTHNGLATFLFDDTRVSHLRVQFTQETKEWARDDFWAQGPMTYTPGAIAEEVALRAEFETERRLEAPIKPWASLPVSARDSRLDAFDGDAAPEDISANGLVIDGTVYVKSCTTRSGPYPYCRHMRHGVFSVTKSLGAGVALLRLAQKYGDGVFDLKIADHVKVTATHDGWNDVTFADALSMAAPIGDNGPQRDWLDPEPDENKPKMIEWVLAPTAQAKLDRGFSYGKYPWARGEVVRYNSTVTFVLAAAMDAFLKQKAGPNAHLWDMVVDEVFRPIGILHLPTMHTRESDGSRGIPLLGYGLYPTVDDIAKLTTLLQNGGRHDGQQILSATKLAEALYRTRATGLPTLRSNLFGEQRYHLSFWSVPYRTDLGCFFQIPYMAGYGGNLVALLPNGVSAFRFSDGHNYDVDSMILAGEAIRPFCTSPPPGAAPKAIQQPPLTATELHGELPGNTFRVGGLRLYIAPDGIVYSTLGSGFDIGRWRITPEGLYCRTWNVTDGGRKRCYRVYREAETFTLHVHDRFGVVKLTRARGKSQEF
ncbi:MAG TPA: serine hydrolase domain-containing protein [Methylomirabilota bacterium]|nr:serine hydrolase domain-containing protein [Methylomirabilota bacterium]